MFKVTEKKCIAVLDEPCNPVFLVWKNSAGGWSYFMFEFKQEIIDIADKGAIFERYVPYLEDATGTFTSLQRFADRRISVQASGITIDEYNAIKELNTSPKIYQMFKMFNEQGDKINRNSKGDPQRIELISVSTTNKYMTNNFRMNAGFSLQYPRIFTQNQI